PARRGRYLPARRPGRRRAWRSARARRGARVRRRGGGTCFKGGGGARLWRGVGAGRTLVGHRSHGYARAPGATEKKESQAMIRLRRTSAYAGVVFGRLKAPKP